MCISQGYSCSCYLLVNREAILNGNRRFGNAVHAAAMAGHVHIAEVLLEAGANVNIEGSHFT